MKRNSKVLRGKYLAQRALGLALTFGLLGGTAMVATPALAGKPAAPKVTLSKPFQAVVIPLNKAIEDAKKRADVVAAQAKATAAQTAMQQARGAAARAQSRTAYDAAVAELGTTLTAEKGQLEAAFAAISTPDDRYTFGQLAVALGGLAQDPAGQRRGLVAMLDSGKVPPADAPRFQYFVGSIAFDARDYAGARAALTAATQGGYHDNDADALLADAYISDNQAPQGLALLKTAIDQRKAGGQAAPENWYRRGLGAAYKAKLLDATSDFSMGLVQAYPSNDNWSGAITILREIGHYPAQETLDLMRLMGRTNSYAEERDYIEYIQSADARRLPGEVMKVIDAGVAAHKLNPADVFINEAKTIAIPRIAADQKGLAALESDARSAGATAATATAAGDAFLSYENPAKAEALYAIALNKAGADIPRILTRLGIAQTDQGNYAAAQANFARITGPRKPIAQLWSIYAAQKAAPAPVAAAPK